MRIFYEVIKKTTLRLIVFLLLTPLPCIFGYDAPESDPVKTFRSLKKLDEFPLYTMCFYGDYDLPSYRPEISSPKDRQVEYLPGNLPSWACTCFSAQTEQGSQLLGRNFDWGTHPALLLFTDPPDRFASVSMVDISYLGYLRSDDPKKNPGGLLLSPLLPFDGMNEQGLAVGMMALPSAQAPEDPQKRTVGSLLIIRLMLDHAKNVDEAITIIQSFNIGFQGGPPLHYFITDKSGRSVVVEFVNRKISVIPNTRSWHVATNFVITGLSPESSLASCWRYKKVWEALENESRLRSPSHALSLLKDVSQQNTVWSVVYDTSSLSGLVVMGKKYDHVHDFNLKQTVSGQ